MSTARGTSGTLRIIQNTFINVFCFQKEKLHKPPIINDQNLNKINDNFLELEKNMKVYSEIEIIYNFHIYRELLFYLASTIVQ